MNFFFDVDGTILPFGKGAPESAVRAIRNLRRDGHRAFLATGRSHAEVPQSVYDIGFDGGVFAAGASVICGGKVIYKRIFSAEEKEAALSYCRERGFRTLVQTDEGTYITAEGLSFWRSLMHAHMGAEIVLDSLIISDALPTDAEVNKILYVTEGYNIQQIRAEIGDRFSIVDNTVGLPRDNMGEIVLKGVTKATGIDRVLEYLGEDISSTAAFGDGANDIEMVTHAAVGIAMGNSSEDLKAAASWVAPDVENDGLEKGIDFAIRALSGAS